MPHSPSLGGGLSGDEPNDGLLHVFLYERGGVLLVSSANLSDHDDGIGSAVGLECLQAVDEVCADDWIAADADAGALADAASGQVIHHLIGERAAAGDQTDPARDTDVSRNDADLARSRRDQSGTVRANEPHPTRSYERHGSRHVHHRNSLRDTHDQPNAGIRGFHDGTGRRGRGHVDHAGVGVCFCDRFGDDVEDRDLALEFLSALPRGDTGDHPGAVLEHLPGVEGPFPARDPLDDQPCVLSNEDAYAASRASRTTCSTAWSMSLRARIPTPSRILMAAAPFVPVSRMTIGTF